MRLWSIRKFEEWEQLEQNGVLITDPARIDKDFLVAYRWITKELEKKVPKPHSDCQFPLWAWQCWDSERSCRPDLRVRWGEAGEKLVLMTLDIPDELVLLSDFQLWHFVLTRWFLAKNQKEEKLFEALCEKQGATSKPIGEQQMIASWQQIFHWQDIDSRYFGEGVGESIQAVFWEIQPHWVQSVKVFHSK